MLLTSKASSRGRGAPCDSGDGPHAFPKVPFSRCNAFVVGFRSSFLSFFL